jgi:hypothetical protein
MHAKHWVRVGWLIAYTTGARETPRGRTDSPCGDTISLVNTVETTRREREILAQVAKGARCLNRYLIPGRNGGPDQYVNCGSRLVSVCPSCAQTFAGDWRNIFRSGILDCDVSAYAWQWVTLTAPGFGETHRVPSRADASRCRCKRHHRKDEVALAGVPIDMDTYDYDAAVMWNMNIGVLWDRTRRNLRDAMPGMEYCLVKEWQARGSLHLHVLIRVPPLEKLSDRVLESLASKSSARIVDFRTGEVTTMGWGRQVRVETIEKVGSRPEDVAKQIWYLSKALNYAAKSFSEGHSSLKAARKHAAELGAAARRLRCDKCPKEVDGGPRCRAKCHRQFGARSHVVSVSRGTDGKQGWSLTGLTRGKLKQDRSDWAELRARRSSG